MILILIVIVLQYETSEDSGTFAVSFYLMIGPAVACILGIATVQFITRTIREKKQPTIDRDIELKEDTIMY